MAMLCYIGVVANQTVGERHERHKCWGARRTRRDHTMTRETLDVRIRREVDQEADNILGELARLMSPALRTRAEQVAMLATALKFAIPAPIAWMLDLQDVDTRAPAPKEYPSGSEGWITRIADEEHITREEARALLVEGLRSEGEPILRGRLAREAEVIAAAEADEADEARRTGDAVDEGRRARAEVVEEIDVPVVRRTTQVEPPSVSVRPSTTERSGPVVRPPLDVQHVTVRAKKPAAKKPAPADGYVQSDGATRATPTHPGPEAMPEHLRGMPAAKGRGALRPRIKAAEGEFKVYEDVRLHPTTTVPETVTRTNLPKGRVGTYTRNLLETGLLAHTGIERWAVGQKAGRAGKELVVVEGALPPTSGRPPVADPDDTAVASDSSADRPTPSLGDELSTRGTSPSSSAIGASGRDASEKGLNEAASSSDLTGVELLAAIRDYAVAQEDKGPFTSTAAAEGVGVAEPAAAFALALLAEQSRGAIVLDVGAPGIKAYEYNKMRPGAMGMGAAAQRDHAKGEGASNGAGAAPVHGTGRRFLEQFSGTPEVQRLVRLAEKKWPGSASKRGSQHIMIKPPNHQPITIGANSKGSALRKDQTLLERAGLVGAIT